MEIGPQIFQKRKTDHIYTYTFSENLFYGDSCPFDNVCDPFG